MKVHLFNKCFLLLIFYQRSLKQNRIILKKTKEYFEKKKHKVLKGKRSRKHVHLEIGTAVNVRFQLTSLLK